MPLYDPFQQECIGHVDHIADFLQNAETNSYLLAHIDR